MLNQPRPVLHTTKYEGCFLQTSFQTDSSTGGNKTTLKMTLDTEQTGNQLWVNGEAVGHVEIIITGSLEGDDFFEACSEYFKVRN